MKLFYIIVGVAIVGGIIGYLFSDNDNHKEGAAEGAAMGVVGCLSILTYVGGGLLVLYVIIKIFAWIFS